MDPWGFIQKPEQVTTPIAQSRRFKIARTYVSSFNVFSPLRIAGPLGKIGTEIFLSSYFFPIISNYFCCLGPYLVTYFRPDLEAKFGEAFMKYVYHCNVQNPT